MARNYDVHGLTLAQVPSLLRVDGTWPGPITLRAGWFRARARPWNETVADPMVRLDRGGTEFLVAVAKHLHSEGAIGVFSPALYPDASGVWRRAGFDDHARLDVMERSLDDPPVGDRAVAREDPHPNWNQILDIDRSAFDGFWGMSRLGLEEAVDVSRTSALLVAGSADDPSGYAIVGSQWGTVYLHRIAVLPSQSGQGLGSALLAAAIEWGTKSGARSIILNVRPDNLHAKDFYAHHGFVETGTALEVLRHE